MQCRTVAAGVIRAFRIAGIAVAVFCFPPPAATAGDIAILPRDLGPVAGAGIGPIHALPELGQCSLVSF